MRSTDQKLRRLAALHEINPILLEQIGTATEDGVKQGERSKRPIETPDRAGRPQREKSPQAHLRETCGQWPRPMADLQASGLAH
jgi:hypothetical protein